ncbi:M20/M25/M40 family metallo-hydrolase [Lutibacter holmesii]|uniref:M20/M25/M40 family metallo-hydrolase n=1 Tax=Lutibacter holmesii TaxID=1137985 RepID=A0ABW3WKB3_9FLAO
MKKAYSLFFCFLVLFVGTKVFSQNQVAHTQNNIDTPTLKIEETLSRYLQFNSTSGQEKEAGEWLKALCKEKGLFVTEMGQENGNYNFSASLYPLSKKLPNIILLNHIDVVPEGDLEKWEFPPYSGTITDTEVWGRGAFDNKGNGIMQLFSILDLKAKYKDTQLPYNITFLAVSVEETQGDGGAKFVVKNYLEELNPAMVIGEGAPGLIGILDPESTTPLFGISVAHKRALWIELELSIKTFGHGSVSPKSYVTKDMNEALHRVLKKKSKVVFNDLNVEFLKQLGAIEKGFTGWVLKHPKLFKWALTSKLREKEELFALFSNTITCTGVHSEGDAINVIPSKVTATLDCRLLPYESSEQFLSDLRKKLKNDAIQISIKENMPGVTPSDTESIYYKSIEKALLTMYPKSDIISTLLPNFNDVGAFRLFNVPGYAITPVILSRAYLEKIHNENERVPIEILEKGKDSYAAMIVEILNSSAVL